MKALLISLLILSCCLPAISHAKAAHVDATDDAANLDADPLKFLFWTDKQRTAGFRNIDKIFPTRAVRASSYTLELKDTPSDFGDLRYQVGGKQFSLSDYTDETDLVGLLVIKDGNIVHEQYLAGNDEDSLWVSFSMAKSVTSMLIGAAIKDGYIKSVDEKVPQYLPRLAGSSYDDVSIRNVLQMASGVAWDETYDDPDSDVNTLPRDYLGLSRTLGAKPREAAAGDKFNYNTGETNLVGAILRAAIGNNLSTYLEAKIWQPFGMESDANWMLDAAFGGEMGGCCLNITLRDYGRLGLFAMSGGRFADGTSPLPDGWMTASTQASKGASYYGYLWWLGQQGTYSALGIFGQSIYMDPANNLVVVALANYDTAVGDSLSEHRGAFNAAMSARFGQ
jgi:CubicO group peptidase (beta-lactamase class C family)